MESPINGLAWVERGELRVSDPGPGGQPATVLPCPGVELIVNGQSLSSEVSVTLSRLPVIRTLDVPPSVSYEVHIADGGASAYLTVRPKVGCVFRVRDQAPSEKLVLEVTAVQVSAQPNLSDAMEALRARGVVHGVDEQACREACNRPNEPVLVAQGEPCTPGKDGKVHLAIPMERILDLPADSLQLDFRDAVKIPDVKAGQAIAYKEDPVPGTPGLSVTGKPIVPPRPRDPKFRAGNGVEMKKEGPLTAAIATVSGYPRYVENSGLVSVDPVLVHKGDVDLSSGNLKSSGSLEVRGDVTEGMRLECEGDQVVWGTVTEASLKALGSIKVQGNVFKSTITSGKDASWAQAVCSLLNEVQEKADSLLELEAQIRQVLPPGFSGPIDISSIREDLYIDTFRAMVASLLKLSKEATQLPDEFLSKIEGARESLTGSRAPLFDRIREISQHLSEVGTWLDSEIRKGKSDVVLRYVQNSSVTAARDILVLGAGAYYSQLIAGRSIRVEGSPGLLRGGQAEARETIMVNQAGGVGAAPTLLKVGPTGRITVKTLFPNTVLQIGRSAFRPPDVMTSVTASLVDQRLLVRSSSGVTEV